MSRQLQRNNNSFYEYLQNDLRHVIVYVMLAEAGITADVFQLWINLCPPGVSVVDGDVIYYIF